MSLEFAMIAKSNTFNEYVSALSAFLIYLSLLMKFQHIKASNTQNYQRSFFKNILQAFFVNCFLSFRNFRKKYLSGSFLIFQVYCIELHSIKKFFVLPREFFLIKFCTGWRHVSYI